MTKKVMVNVDGVWTDDPAAVDAALAGLVERIRSLELEVSRLSADSPKCSATVNKTVEPQSGMRKERVVLEVTHPSPNSLHKWQWDMIVGRYCESVRVVDDEPSSAVEAEVLRRAIVKSEIQRLKADAEAQRLRKELEARTSTTGEGLCAAPAASGGGVIRDMTDILRSDADPDEKHAAMATLVEALFPGWVLAKADVDAEVLRRALVKSEIQRLKADAELKAQNVTLGEGLRASGGLKPHAWGAVRDLIDAAEGVRDFAGPPLIRNEQRYRAEVSKLGVAIAVAEKLLADPQPAVPATGGGEQLREQVAAIVHEAMRFYRVAETAKWQGGNSFAEDRAREAATEIAELTQAASGGGEVETEYLWCDGCGSSFACTESSGGRRTLIEPDNAFGGERWENLCASCASLESDLPRDTEFVIEESAGNGSTERLHRETWLRLERDELILKREELISRVAKLEAAQAASGGGEHFADASKMVEQPRGWLTEEEIRSMNWLLDNHGKCVVVGTDSYYREKIARLLARSTPPEVVLEENLNLFDAHGDRVAAFGAHHVRKALATAGVPVKESP